MTAAPTPTDTSAGDVAIRLERLTKTYPGASRPAVDGLDLTIPRGELVALVGPSGCGKTTTLKMINRLIEPTGGTVWVEGVDIRTRPTHELRRGIGYVIQQAGLFPHRTVGDNIATVPKLLGWDRDRANARVDELADLLRLDRGLLGRYPAALSGGQQQRVGVARALAADPPVLLMDEPYSAVDPIVRAQLQDELLRLQREVHKTIVFVTHDIDEAIKLADRIAILNVGGILEQVDSPAEMLRAPRQRLRCRLPGRRPRHQAAVAHDRGRRLAEQGPAGRRVRQRRRRPGHDGRAGLRLGGRLRRRRPAAGVGRGRRRSMGRHRRRAHAQAHSCPWSPPTPRSRRRSTASSRPTPEWPWRWTTTGDTWACSPSTTWPRGSSHDPPTAARPPSWSGFGFDGNWDVVWHYTLVHLRITASPWRSARLVAFPLGLAGYRWRRSYPAILGVTNVLYTIPSLSLIVLLGLGFGLGLLNDKPLIVALAIYTLAILVRNLVEGLRAVPDSVKEAAAGVGYTPRALGCWRSNSRSPCRRSWPGCGSRRSRRSAW